MEDELERVVRHLVENRWPFRLHATYDESISRMLDVFEKVNRDIPFNGLHWFFDHAETITERNIESVLTLVAGKVVYATGRFSQLSPPPIPVLLDWSPVVNVPGHYCPAPPAMAKVGGGNANAPVHRQLRGAWSSA